MPIGETLFFFALLGAYFAVFGVTIQLLRRRKRRSWVVLSTMLGLFLTTTATLGESSSHQAHPHLADVKFSLSPVLCVIDNYDAWIRAREHEGVIPYFASMTSLIKVTKESVAHSLMALPTCWLTSTRIF